MSGDAFDAILAGIFDQSDKTLTERLLKARDRADALQAKDTSRLAFTLAEAIEHTIEPAVDEAVESYRVARRSDGRIAGFAAFWEQSPFKQLRVTRYSTRLAGVRFAFNALAPLLGASRLPPAGGELRHATAFHVCVPSDEPAVLRALVRDAHDDLRSRGHSLLTVGLDVRDPLSAALDGLFAQPTDVHAYACTATGDYTGPALDERVLHYEIALV